MFFSLSYKIYTLLVYFVVVVYNAFRFDAKRAGLRLGERRAESVCPATTTRTEEEEDLEEPKETIIVFAAAAVAVAGQTLSARLSPRRNPARFASKRKAL